MTAINGNVPESGGINRGQWQPGQSGNPAGRPKGSRSKLSEAFIKALADDFSEHGVAVIQQVRSERPQDYLKIVAALQPKQVELDAPVRYVARLPEPAKTVEEWQASIAKPINIQALPGEDIKAPRLDEK